MSIFCAITALIQLVILVALTGVLVSIAAVARLMEVAISFIYPMTLFMLRQSGKLVIWSVNQSARLTSHAFRKMCRMDCSGIPGFSLFAGPRLMIGGTQPEIAYTRNVIPAQVEETESLSDAYEQQLGEPAATPAAGQNGVETVGMTGNGAGSVEGTGNGAGTVEGTGNGAGTVEGTGNGAGTVEGTGNGAGTVEGTGNGAGTVEGTGNGAESVGETANGVGTFEEAANGVGEVANGVNTAEEPEELEVILTDLSAKFPCLQYILRPNYAPYLNTAGTILLGWLIVSWISYVVCAVLAPLTVTVIAIILICPMTAKWCLMQTVPWVEEIFNDFVEKFQVNFSQGPTIT